MARITDKRIKEYTKKDGTIAYMFNAYLGRVNGKDKRITRRGFRTPREARLALIALEAERDSLLEVTNKYSFEEIYLNWFKQYKNTVKESTWAKTESIFKLHILPVFGDKIITEITPMDCQTAINSWYESGKKKYKVFMNYTGNVFQYAFKMDIVQSDPTKKIFIPKNPNKLDDSKINFFDKQELLTFFKAVDEFGDQQAAMCFHLLAFTGMRKGELLALTWDDIDLKAATLDINKTQTLGAGFKLITQTPKTKNSHRTLNLDDNTVKRLKKWKVVQKEQLLAFGTTVKLKEQLVFSNEGNEFLQPNYPGKWMDWIIKKYNKDKEPNEQLKRITVHGLRHTYATLAFEAGASIKEVQEQLGHLNFKTTMDIYTAVTQKQKIETSTKFAEYLAK